MWKKKFAKKLIFAGGGCSAPVAVCSTITDENFSLTGAVWNLSGEKLLQKTRNTSLSSGEPLR